MAEAKIVPTDNGPYWVSGEFVVTDSDGNEFAVDGDGYLCRCGASDDKPFCDGSHNSNGFSDSCRVA